MHCEPEGGKMRNLFLLLFFFFYPSFCWGLITGYSGVSASGASFDATYDFEGADAFGSGTLASWASAVGTPDPNYSSAGLDMESSDVVELVATEKATLTVLDNTDTTKYITFKFRLNEAIESNELAVVTVKNASSATICQFGISSTLAFRHTALAGTLRVGTANEYTVNTSVFLRLRCSGGTGADATSQMWYSADGTSWTEVATASADGTTTGNPNTAEFQNPTDTEVIYFDYLIENPTIINDASY